MAYNGEEAVEKFKAKYLKKCGNDCSIYKLIMMDLNMPRMTGWEATK